MPGLCSHHPSCLPDIAYSLSSPMTIQQIAQAIAIASDPAQSPLHHQALQFIAEIQQNASETWRLALPIFVDRDSERRKKYMPQARFFALRVLDDFLDNR